MMKTLILNPFNLNFEYLTENDNILELYKIYSDC